MRTSPATDSGAGAPSFAVVTTPDTLRAALARAAAARSRVLATASNERLVEALAGAAEAWRNHALPERVRAVAALAPALRMHADMLGCGLDFLFDALSRDGLRAMLSEAGDPAALERPQPRPDAEAARLLGPRVVFHSLAGNVPGLAVPPIVTGILARSVTIVRDSARQPVLTAAFLETLAARDEDAARMIVAAAWTAGDSACEREVLERSERAEIYGSDATLRAIRRRHRGARAALVEHGTRMSIGLVPGCADLGSLHEGFALDAALYDGLGCLSPHAIVVTGPARARALAESLARSLDDLQVRWPRQPRAFEEEASRRRFIDGCEAATAADPLDELWRGTGDAWIVHLTHDRAPLLGPGLRCLQVIAFEDDERALASLAAIRVPLAAVGLALPPGHPSHAAIASRLRVCGATLICLPGTMQAPPLSWTQDGHRRLGDLLEWRAEEP